MRGCKPVTRLSSQDWESLEEGLKPQNSCSWSQSPHCPARRFQHQSKVSSKKRLFLVKYCRWVYCPWRRGEKNRRNQEPVLWWLQNWTVISVWTCGDTFRRTVPRLNACRAVFSTTLHLLESKIRAAQACSLFLVPVPPRKESSFKWWRLLLTFVRHLKTLKMVTWYWAGAVLLKCCCWKQCYTNINILLARRAWYLYVALSHVNIWHWTKMSLFCARLLADDIPSLSSLMEIVNWGPNMKAFQLQHFINEILTFQMQSVAALSTSKKCSNAHGFPGKSCVLLLLNLLRSLRNRNGSKIEWLCGFWAKLERKGIFCYRPLICRAFAFKQTKKNLCYHSKCAAKVSYAHALKPVISSQMKSEFPCLSCQYFSYVKNNH